MTAEVVTSENLTEFNNSRVRWPADSPADLKPEPEKSEKEPEKSEQVEAKPETEPEQPKHRGNKPISERFSELTNQRKAAEERAEAAERKAAELEARIKAVETPVKQADPTAKPVPSDFTDAFEYAAKLAEWSADNALRNRDKLDAEKREQERLQQMQTDWNSRLVAARAKLPDYDEVMINSELTVSDQVRDAIRESEMGPELAYHLASNPELALKINGMTVIGALRAIGKLEATLEKPAAPKDEPVKQAATKLPEPIKPIRAQTTPDEPINSAGEFTGTFQQWKAMRKNKRIN
jgi:DNA repair exonuclease SbcCD ATPase subunit